MNLLQKIRGKSGQSTVEYILLVTAVIAVMILFATNKDSGLQQKLSNTYNAVGTEMADKAGDLSDSHTTPSTNAAVISVPQNQSVTIPTLDTIK